MTKKQGTVATMKRDTPLRMGRPYGAFTAGLQRAATPGVSSSRLRRRFASLYRTASVQHSRHVAATLGNARKGNNEVGDGK